MEPAGHALNPYVSSSGITFQLSKARLHDARSRIPSLVQRSPKNDSTAITTTTSPTM